MTISILTATFVILTTQVNNHANNNNNKNNLNRGGGQVPIRARGNNQIIEIPPPRPKQKLIHPYPCKLVKISKNEISNLEQPLRSN